MTHRLFVSLAVPVLLAACAGAPVATSPGAAPARQVAPLEEEQRFLNGWFKDTPVQIGLQDDGALRVAVPLRNSFDAGQVKVKPALGAVLDKVSTSLQRQPGSRLQVAAPPDLPAGKLADERGASVRDYLVGKGVRPNRIVRAAAPSQALVELRMLPPTTAIERLEDAPMSSSGTRAPAVPAKR